MNLRYSARQGTRNCVEVSSVFIIMYSQILYLTIYHLVAIIHTAGARAVSFLNDGSNSTIAVIPEESFFCTGNIILILLLFIHILTLLLFYSTVEGERGEDGDEGGMRGEEGGLNEG